MMPFQAPTVAAALPPRLVCRLGDGQAAYLEAGDGPPVVLLHGLLMSADEMALGLFDALASRFRVLSFDRPGHGASTRPAGDGSLAVQARCLFAALEAIGLDRPVLVGHSIGASLALFMALQRPDAVRGVVAIAPLAAEEPRLERMLFGPRGLPFVGPIAAAPWLRAFDVALLPLLWNGIFLPQIMPADFVERFPFARFAWNGEMIATGEDTLAISRDLLEMLLRYADCRVPVHLLGGSADIVVDNRRHGAMVAKLLPDARFETVPGMGHMLHHFSQDRVVAAIDHVLRQPG